MKLLVLGATGRLVTYQALAAATMYRRLSARLRS
jgi:hypothetical protein